MPVNIPSNTSPRHPLPGCKPTHRVNWRSWISAPCILAICIFSNLTFAQSDAGPWPTRPIRLIVSFAPGGFTDIAARLIATYLTKELGQNVIVDNRAGAAGIIGTQLAATSPPDGYTLLVGTISTFSMNPGLYKKLPYDVEKNFASISGMAIGQLILVANSGLKAATVAELISLAKSSPKKLTYGSGGSGTTSHLAAEWFKAMASTDILHVPYRSPALATQALLGGEIDIMFDTIPTALPHIRSGKFRALGIGSLQPSPELPGVPGIAETLPGFDTDTWVGMFAPKDTPPAIISRLVLAMNSVLTQPALKTKLAEIGMQPLVFSRPGDFDSFVKKQTERWTQVIRKAGITAEQ